MTEPASPSLTAISKGSRKRSLSSRQPRWTGAWLRAPSLKEWPAKCLRVASRSRCSPCRPRTKRVPSTPTRYGSSPQGLLGAPPADVARDVEHRRQPLAAADAARPRGRWRRRPAPPARGSRWRRRRAPRGRASRPAPSAPPAHSSCERTGMPSRVSSTQELLQPVEGPDARRGSTPWVPSGRVICPARAPAAAQLDLVALADEGVAADRWLPSSERISQKAWSWAIFSSSVMRASRSLARSGMERAGSW